VRARHRSLFGQQRRTHVMSLCALQTPQRLQESLYRRCGRRGGVLVLWVFSVRALLLMDLLMGVWLVLVLWIMDALLWLWIMLWLVV
jgi:hypothetical protein